MDSLHPRAPSQPASALPGPYDALPRHATVAIALTGVCFFFTWTTLFLRLWTRAYVLRKLGWDDGILLLANCFFTAGGALVMSIETVAGGTHPENLTWDQLEFANGLEISSFALYILSVILLKISLGLFYLRILVRPWQRMVVFATVGLSTAFGFGYFWMITFRCGNPKDALINTALKKCIDPHTVYAANMSAGVINAVTDWILAILPVSILVQLDMARSAKISAGCLLFFGAAGSIFSLIRLSAIRKLYLANLLNVYDRLLLFGLWSVLECGLGITAASAAALRPLFRKRLGGTRGTSPAGEGKSFDSKCSTPVLTSPKSPIKAPWNHVLELDDVEAQTHATLSSHGRAVSKAFPHPGAFDTESLAWPLPMPRSGQSPEPVDDNTPGFVFNPTPPGPVDDGTPGFFFNATPPGPVDDDALGFSFNATPPYVHSSLPAPHSLPAAPRAYEIYNRKR